MITYHVTVFGSTVGLPKEHTSVFLFEDHAREHLKAWHKVSCSILGINSYDSYCGNYFFDVCSDASSDSPDQPWYSGYIEAKAKGD